MRLERTSDRTGIYYAQPDGSEIREAICGTVCRCTGYENIVRAIRWAAEHPALEEVPA